MPTTFRSRLELVKRYSGLLGVAVIWSGVIRGMLLAGLKVADKRPISYLGTNPHSAWLFSGSLIVSAILFLTFGLYLKTVYQLSSRFSEYLVIGQLGQIVAALVPYIGNFRPVHTLAAFTLAFSLPLLINQFTIAQLKAPHYQIYRRLLWCEQITFVVGIGIFVFTRGIAPIGEALPAIGFDIWIITVTAILIQPRSPGLPNPG